MACKCAPCLKRLMAEFAARGHVNSGCCGDLAHQARKSDHNPDGSGYAHAQDIHEKADHDMQPFVDFIMANPAKFPLVKYLIYEGHIYYPSNGARARGRYVYTGPNAHAAHLHVSIHADTHFWPGDWHVAAAYGTPPAPPQEDDEMAAAIKYGNDLDVFVVEGSALVTRYYQPASGWHRLELATGVKADAQVAVVRDYQDEKGRLDIFAEGDTGLVHAWFSANQWHQETLT